MRFFSLFALSFIFISSTAMAGVLFPPSNATKSGSVYSCPNNSALVWSTDNNGSLKCADTTQMVTIASCPAGQVMAGINNGVATCIPSPNLTLSCPAGQVLSGINNGTAVCATPSAAASGVTANCPGGYVLTGIRVRTHLIT